MTLLSQLNIQCVLPPFIGEHATKGYNMLVNLQIQLKTVLLASILSGFATISHAQIEEEPKWYQIEVAVFTQPENAQLAASEETFRKDVQLSYGEHTQALRSLDDLTSLQNNRETAANSYEGGTQSSLEMEQTSAQAATPEAQLNPAEIALQLQQSAFIKLPAEQRNLNETVGALERRNRQRILFHEAWRQPLLDPKTAAAIIINGGKSFGEEKELSGTITFAVARYIHVSTNLWFAQFEKNYGQGNQDWPTPPLAPTAHNGNIIDTEINLDAGLSSPKADLWQQFDVIDSTYQNILNKPFAITSLATLSQTRRMRSGEVHYIDHPKIGILITVIPFERTAVKNN